MRISDWSSDVCSSDLSDEDSADLRYFDQSHRNRDFRRFIGMTPQTFAQTPTPLFTASLKLRLEHRVEIDRNRGEATGAHDLRSEERRVGKECVSTCRSRRSPNN